MTQQQRITPAVLWHNMVAGLTVSFVAISLGAAFGILSGRGAFAGIISAGIIAFITAALGGTRVQTSGPTAPMTAVSAVVVAFAYDQL
ncbi:MAG: SulP family inorganic anion transporter, partial [Gemmatimonadales bacterium]